MQHPCPFPSVGLMRDLLTTPAATIEADFAALQRAISRSPVLSSADEPDATVYWSHLPVAAVNVVCDAHIRPEDVPTRVPQLLDPFVARGLPFMWMTTPSTTTPALEAALAQAGLLAREYPAMHASLGGEADPGTGDDVYIDVAWPDQVAPVNAGVFNAFGQPEQVVEESLAILDSLDPADNEFFVARSLRTGQPLGASTMHHRGASVMFANTGTVPAARGTGIHRALTATMMNRAVSRGATSATLVATGMSYPTYVSLGFRTQFDLVTWVWDPRR